MRPLRKAVCGVGSEREDSWLAGVRNMLNGAADGGLAAVVQVGECGDWDNYLTLQCLSMS